MSIKIALPPQILLVQGENVGSLERSPHGAKGVPVASDNASAITGSYGVLKSILTAGDIT